MFSRATLLRRTANHANSAIRRTFATEAVAAEGNKLKLNFFLPHDSIKSNAAVVSRNNIRRARTHSDLTLSSQGHGDCSRGERTHGYSPIARAHSRAIATRCRRSARQRREGKLLHFLRFRVCSQGPHGRVCDRGCEGTLFFSRFIPRSAVH